MLLQGLTGLTGCTVPKDLFNFIMVDFCLAHTNDAKRDPYTVDPRIYLAALIMQPTTQ